MLPGGSRGGMNPKQLAAMMKSMGITVQEIDDVQEVVIRTAKEEIVITDADVQKMTTRGQAPTWQVMGKESRRPRAAAPAPATAAAPGPLFTDADVELVAEQAKVSKDEARKALEAAKGEPAEAILKLLGE